MFSTFLKTVTVSLFGDIHFHDAGKFQHHITDIAMRLIFTITNKTFCLYFYGDSEACDCSCCLSFCQEQRKPSFLTISSFLNFVSDFFIYFYSLLFHYHLNTLYMIWIPLQCTQHRGSLLMSSGIVLNYLHDSHSSSTFFSKSLLAVSKYAYIYFFFLVDNHLWMILSQYFSIVASIVKLPFSYLLLNYQVNYFKFHSEGDTFILYIT